jgi:hypothetical protein
MPIKNYLGLKTPGVYTSPESVGRCILDKTRRYNQVGIKKHHRPIRLYHPEQLAAVEQNKNFAHRDQFHDTSILTKKSGRSLCLIEKAIEIEFHPT